MARFPSLSLAFLLSSLLPLVYTLKFDLAAHTGHHNKYDRCIRNFVAKETLVLVTAIVDGHKGDGQVVNMHVCRFYIKTLVPSAETNSFRSKMQREMNMEDRKIS